MRVVTTRPHNGSNLAGVPHIRKTIEFNYEWRAKERLKMELRPGELLRNEIVKTPSSGCFFVFLGCEGPRGLRSCDHRVVPHDVKQTKNKKNPLDGAFASQAFTWPQFHLQPLFT